MSTDYSKFAEVMSYFHFIFNIYYVLVTILVLNASKAVVNFYKTNNKSTTSNTYELVISTLVGFALANALFFHGVLSDVSSVESDRWLGNLFGICFVAAIAYVFQVAFFLLNSIKSKKSKSSSTMKENRNL